MTNGIILSGLTLNDLLEKIGEVIDNRLGKSVPNKLENQSDYLSRKEVSKLLKITLPTLHDWTKQGILKSYRIGTRVLYKESEVKQTLEKVPHSNIEKEGYSMHKTKMYACFAFFPDGSVKRWKYVRNLTSFMLFLQTSHPTWKYFNVYEKGSKQFAKRFYPGNTVPKVLGLLLLFSLLTQKFTFDKTTFKNSQHPITLKNTFNKATFNNGFNNTATISTLNTEKGGIV